MPAAPRLPFSVNHYLCPPQMTLVLFLDLVAQAGFASVGLTQRALDEMPVPTLRRELADRQLGVSSINSAGFLLGEATDRQRERNLRLVETTAELGAAVLNVLPGQDAALTPERSRALVAEGFGALAGAAERAGLRLALEPLHARRARIGSCINTIAAAARLIGAAPAACLNLDVYHLWDDPDRDRAAGGGGPPLGLVQICDIGRVDGRPQRLPLDEGALQWRPFVRRLQAMQPGVPIELELFADQLPGRDAAAIVAAAARLLAPAAGDRDGPGASAH
jgi:sugar phosphate isomerase/epimerase